MKIISFCNSMGKKLNHEILTVPVKCMVNIELIIGKMVLLHTIEKLARFMGKCCMLESQKGKRILSIL